MYLLLWEYLVLAIRYLTSAQKHGVVEADAIYAMAHAEGREEQQGRSGRTVWVFVGHPHAQTDRYIEVIAELAPPPGDVVIFHAMPLTDLYRHLLA